MHRSESCVKFGLCLCKMQIIDSTLLFTCELHGCSVALEEGFSQETITELEKKGHKITAHVSGHTRGIFGRGQIIKRNPQTGVLWGGSDPRADGTVVGW